MGCDIHAFIEYRSYGGRWRALSGELDLDRNYQMFSLLAGVRGNHEPIVAPRGIPRELAWETQERYTFNITDSQCDWGECSIITPDDARNLVQRGVSQQWSDYRVTDPDAHTPSWLTTEEFAEVLRHYADRPVNIGTIEGYQAVLAAMQALPDARLVFWFDN